MSRFKELNTNLMDILKKVCDNQDLCKLLYYKDDLPLEDLETITDTKSDLMYHNLFPYPFTVGVETKATTILTVILNQFKPSSNSAFKNGSITFNILCHKDLWKVSSMGGLRPFFIMEKIDEMMNEKKMGIGRLQFDSGKLLWANENYSGYSLTYSICEFN